MTNKILFLFFWLCCSSFVYAQDSQGKVMVSANEDGTSVEVKWLESTVYGNDPANVYRRRVNTDEWQLITPAPVNKMNDLSYLESEGLETAKGLAEQIEGKDPNSLDGFLQLLLAIELIKTKELSEYLGLIYEDKSVTYGEVYEYKVTVSDGKKENEVGISPVIAALPHQPLAAVKNVVVEVDAKTDSLVKIRWLPEDERYFSVNIFRTDTETGVRTQINESYVFPAVEGEDPAGNVIYADFFYTNYNHKIGKTYLFELEPVDFFGKPGVLSNPIEITFPDRTLAALPEAWELTKAGMREVYIHWTEVPKKNLSGINIYCKKGDGEYYKINEELIDRKTTSYTHNIEEFGSYFYIIETVNKSGMGGRTFKKSIDLLDIEPPAMPLDMVVTPDTGLVRIVWQPNIETDLDGYIVFRGLREDLSVPFERLNIEPLKKTFYVDEVAKRAKNKFFYKIAAIDTSNNMSAFTMPLSVRLPDVTPPNAPTIIEVSTTATAVTLKWLPILTEAGDFAGCTLYKKGKEEDAVWQQVNSNLLPDSITVYTDVDVKPSADYEYKLTASDQSGNVSEFSNVYNVRVKPDKSIGAGAKKISVSYQKNKKQVTLKWKTGDSQTVKGNVVFRKTGTGRMVAVSPMLTETDSYNDKKVKPGNAYTYQVKTYYNNGKIGTSDPEELVIKSK